MRTPTNVTSKVEEQFKKLEALVDEQCNALTSLSEKVCEIESKIQEQASGNGGDKGMNSPTKHGGKRKKTYSLNIESPQKNAPINDISQQ